jgi:hypothetical protein
MKFYHWQMAWIGVIIYTLTVRFGQPVSFDNLFSYGVISGLDQPGMCLVTSWLPLEKYFAAEVQN